MSDRSDSYSSTYCGYEKTQLSQDTIFRMYKGLCQPRHFCHDGTLLGPRRLLPWTRITLYRTSPTRSRFISLSRRTTHDPKEMKQ